MSNTSIELKKIIKEQVEMFLIDAGEFYPFGTYIDKGISVLIYLR